MVGWLYGVYRPIDRVFFCECARHDGGGVFLKIFVEVNRPLCSWYEEKQRFSGVSRILCIYFLVCPLGVDIVIKYNF